MGRTPTPGIDYTSRDYEGFRQAMLKELGIRMPEYTDLTDTDAGVVILDLLAKGLDINSYYADVIANETLLTTCRRRTSANKWCTMFSYVQRNATPSRVMQVFVLSSKKTTPTTIPAGTRVKTKKSTTEVELIFETESDLVIPAGNLGNEKDADGNYKYQVSAVQGYSIEGELVGSSTGVPNQKFIFNYSPVIADSVSVVVNEGAGFSPWVRVDNFIDSSPIDRHYTLTITDNNEAVIQFGDGVFGKIPLAYSNGIFANYRVGGGTQGNVGANKITAMETNLAVVKSTFNPEAVYERGVDKETVDELRRNAPRYNETRWGALTLQDFADVVIINFPDVVFANSERDKDDIDSIHIYLLTQDGAVIDPDLLAEINEFFDENSGGRKVVGANKIYVEPATLVPLELEADLIVKDRYSRSAVKTEIEKLIQSYFEVGSYPFAQELSLSELATEVQMPENAILGIKSFKFMSPEEPVLTPKPNEIFTLKSLDITAVGGVE